MLLELLDLIIIDWELTGYMYGAREEEEEEEQSESLMTPSLLLSNCLCFMEKVNRTRHRAWMLCLICSFFYQNDNTLGTHLSWRVAF